MYETEDTTWIESLIDCIHDGRKRVSTNNKIQAAVSKGGLKALSWIETAAMCTDAKANTINLKMVLDWAKVQNPPLPTFNPCTL